jgi:hypothetical protein
MVCRTTLIVIACSARGYGSFMMKAVYLAAYVCERQLDEAVPSVPLAA